MKKVISVIAAAAMMCAAVSPVFAENTESASPDVFINGTKIFFDDQPAIVQNERTLVPLRGVFEAMGAKVSWDQEKQQAQVESADGNTWVRLVIGDKNMKVYDMSGLFATLLSGQNFVAPETDIELDVAPQAMNNRTLVPLRAISEAIDADVKWDQEAYAVNITTTDNPTDEELSTMPKYTLSASADTVNEGDTVDVYVNAANFPENTYASSVTVTVQYDRENFEYVETKLVNGDNVVESSMGADNDDFLGNCLKSVYVTIDKENAAKTDGKVMKMTFKSLNGKEGSFALSNGYQTEFGYNTTLYVTSMDDDKNNTMYEGDDLYIDTTPVTVNAGK